MTGALFDYPKHAAFGKVIPKARIVAYSRARGLRDRLSRELADIRRAFKLAPLSTNLPSSPAAAKIQIFGLDLKRECARLEAQLTREQQFNRKVEINRSVRDKHQMFTQLLA